MQMQAFKFIVAVVILFSWTATLMAQAHIGPENYQSQYANSLITNVSNYVATINESGYLIFKPNLSTAYMDLNYAMDNVSSNPSAAVLYAEKANQSAYTQYQSIRYYRSESFPVIVGFTLIMLALLYKFMAPIKKGRKK